MANRYGYDLQSFDRQTKKLYAVLDITDTGNELSNENNNGITSVGITGAGTIFTVTFDDLWVRFLHANVIDTEGNVYALTSVDVVGTAATRQIVLTADVAPAADVFMEFTFKNSDVR